MAIFVDVAQRRQAVIRRALGGQVLTPAKAEGRIVDSLLRVDVCLNGIQTDADALTTRLKNFATVATGTKKMEEAAKALLKKNSWDLSPSLALQIGAILRASPERLQQVFNSGELITTVRATAEHFSWLFDDGKWRQQLGQIPNLDALLPGFAPDINPLTDLKGRATSDLQRILDSRPTLGGLVNSAGVESIANAVSKDTLDALRNRVGSALEWRNTYDQALNNARAAGLLLAVTGIDPQGKVTAAVNKAASVIECGASLYLAYVTFPVNPIGAVTAVASAAQLFRGAGSSESAVLSGALAEIKQMLVEVIGRLQRIEAMQVEIINKLADIQQAVAETKTAVLVQLGSSFNRVSNQLDTLITSTQQKFISDVRKPLSRAYDSFENQPADTTEFLNAVNALREFVLFDADNKAFYEDQSGSGVFGLDAATVLTSQPWSLLADQPVVYRATWKGAYVPHVSAWSWAVDELCRLIVTRLRLAPALKPEAKQTCMKALEEVSRHIESTLAAIRELGDSEAIAEVMKQMIGLLDTGEVNVLNSFDRIGKLHHPSGLVTGPAEQIARCNPTVRSDIYPVYNGVPSWVRNGPQDWIGIRTDGDRKESYSRRIWDTQLCYPINIVSGTGPANFQRGPTLPPPKLTPLGNTGSAYSRFNIEVRVDCPAAKRLRTYEFFEVNVQGDQYYFQATSGGNIVDWGTLQLDFIDVQRTYVLHTIGAALRNDPQAAFVSKVNDGERARWQEYLELAFRVNAGLAAQLWLRGEYGVAAGGELIDSDTLLPGFAGLRLEEGNMPSCIGHRGELSVSPRDLAVRFGEKLAFCYSDHGLFRLTGEDGEPNDVDFGKFLSELAGYIFSSDYETTRARLNTVPDIAPHIISKRCKINELIEAFK
ncbi:MAG: hypothetical protein SFV32_07090 [Opitutaceae bacterium]|nr:hypothetical protein [Opitutaceae bacterium]